MLFNYKIVKKEYGQSLFNKKIKYEIDKSKGANNSNSVEYDASSDSVMLPLTPSGSLQKALNENHGVKSFEEFKTFLRSLWKKESYRNEEAANWRSYEDIPAKECRKLMAICKKS